MRQIYASVSCYMINFARLYALLCNFMAPIGWLTVKQHFGGILTHSITHEPMPVCRYATPLYQARHKTVS